MNGLNTRQDKIIELLQERHFLTVRQLSKELEVSEMTIRRDMNTLQKIDAIKQVYGGITLPFADTANEDGKSYLYSDEKTKNLSLKIKIAQAALNMINDNDVIFLDSGSTIQCLASAIPEDKKLTIITNSFNSLEIVTKLKNSSIIMPGGAFNHKSRVFYSQEANSLTQNVRVSKCFIGATGFNIQLGVTCSYLEDAPIKNSAMNSSLEKILLLDSSKFDKVSAFAFAAISDFTCIVTDDGISDEYRKFIEESGIKLIIA